jgi:hypothetical protein
MSLIFKDYHLNYRIFIFEVLNVQIMIGFVDYLLIHRYYNQNCYFNFLELNLNIKYGFQVYLSQDA